MTQALIIGAGLAGLTAARHLTRAGVSVSVLESRSRLGGRALTLDGVDMGPAWIWPGMQPRVSHLAHDLNLETVPQYEDGDLLLETAQGIQRGAYPKRYGDAARIRGGVGVLVDRLAADLPDGAVRLEQEVTHLDLNARPVVTVRGGNISSADRLIVAAPAPIARQWQVSPPWSTERAQAMTRWPTWMAAHAKIVATYDAPFWRGAGLSGSVISHIGPLFEIADQSDLALGVSALFGFVSLPYAARKDPDVVKAAAVKQLERLFGPAAASPRALHLQDWAAEPFTATQLDQTPPHGHPPYGAPELSDPIGNTTFFAGAELSRRDGGLIEGAIETGTRAAEAVLNSLKVAA